MIGESLANGLYNRMSRTVQDSILRRLHEISKQPSGRMRRSPWFRNRLKELRRVYRDILLFETISGAGKNRVARLFILEVADHQRAQVCCVEVHAREYDIRHKPLCIYVNRHAMARVIQSKGHELDNGMRECFKSVVMSAMKILDGDAASLDTSKVVRIATCEGLSVWEVDAYSCDAVYGLTMKTFIAEDVLDGPNLEIYRTLMDKEHDQRYLLTRKRQLNG